MSEGADTPGTESVGEASKCSKLPIALLVGRKRDAPLDVRRIAEYFGEKFGPVVSSKLGQHSKYKMRLEFESHESMANAIRQKKVTVDKVTLRVLDADSRPVKDRCKPFRLKEMKSLEEQSVLIHNEYKIDTFKERLSFCRKLKDHLQGYFYVGIEVRMFGSSATGFGWKTSDIDITLVQDGEPWNAEAEGSPSAPPSTNGYSSSTSFSHTDKQEATKLLTNQKEEPETKIKLLEIIAKFLTEFPLVGHASVISSKHCPILRFRTSKWQCEMSIENSYGWIKTQWLNYLSHAYDAWLPRLFSTLRYWINFHLHVPPNRTKLNSYCLLLILVSYLQQEGLVEAASEWSEDKQPSKCSTNGTEPNLVTRLFCGFVNFLYGASSRFEHSVFRPRCGVLQDIVHFMMERRDKFKYSCLNVEDPIEVEHNPGYTATWVLLETLKVVLRSACEELRTLPGVLPLKPIHKRLPTCPRPLRVLPSGRKKEFSIEPDGLIYTCIQRYVNNLGEPTLNPEFIRCLFYECCVRFLVTLLCPILLFEITQTADADESMHRLMEEVIRNPSEKRENFRPWPLKVTCSSTARTWRERKNPIYKRGISLVAEYPFSGEAELSRRLATEDSKRPGKGADALQFEMRMSLKNSDDITSVTVCFYSACRSTLLNDFLDCYKYLLNKYLPAWFHHFLTVSK